MQKENRRFLSSEFSVRSSEYVFLAMGFLVPENLGQQNSKSETQTNLRTPNFELGTKFFPRPGQQSRILELL